MKRSSGSAPEKALRTAGALDEQKAVDHAPFRARIQRLPHRSNDRSNHDLTDYIAAADIFDSAGTWVGSVPVRPAIRSDEETEALAKLFAAAPSMRKALEGLVAAHTQPFAGSDEQWTDYLDGLLGKAKAALSLAKDTTHG